MRSRLRKTWMLFFATQAVWVGAMALPRALADAEPATDHGAGRHVDHLRPVAKTLVRPATSHADQSGSDPRLPPHAMSRAPDTVTSTAKSLAAHPQMPHPTKILRAPRPAATSPKIARLNHREILRWVIRFSLLLAGLVFFASWRRRDEPDVEGDATPSAFDGATFDKFGNVATTAPARFHARPVILARDVPDFDAANAHVEDVIQRFNDHLIPDVAKAEQSPTGTPVLLLEQGSASSAAIAEMKLKEDDSARGPMKSPEQGYRPLPAELGEHFALFAGETLQWSAGFSIQGRLAGRVALTDRRFLAAYERRHIGLMPPRWTLESKRFAAPLAQIKSFAIGSERRALLPIVGITTALFFPFGSLIAFIAIIAFPFSRRPRLDLKVGGQTRHFPLPLVDSQEALRILAKIKGDRSDGVKPAA